MDAGDYYIIALVASAVAAVISIGSLLVAFKSFKTARQTLDSKYQLFVDAKFEQGHYDKVDDCFKTEVILYNIGEVPVLVTAKLTGELLLANGNVNVDTPLRRITIKSGESQKVNIDLITGGFKGKAKLFLDCKLKNSRNSITQKLELERIDL